MRKIVLGILAHVDAGKTTLAEALLYTSGNIRELGRVDNQNAFLDTYALERERGITVFSKQAQIELENTSIALLDTPGHVDFSAEMERTLQVLDYAILVISGADGVQGHTRTLWQLLEKYQIPTFLFVNKMDQAGTEKEPLLEELKNRLDEGCIAFGEVFTEKEYEEIAVCDEVILESFLESGTILQEEISKLILERKIFPCYFGSALKLEGIKTFIKDLEHYTKECHYPSEFGAKVFKITRDEQGNRLTYMKITGGSLRVKEVIISGREAVSEKIHQIRIYSGEKFEVVEEIAAGSVCAVVGLNSTYSGEGLGSEKVSKKPVLEPVLTYQIILPMGLDAAQVMPKLRQLEEEEPELHIVWNEELQEIQAQLMGAVQVEILKDMLLRRFDLPVEFGKGNIVYKETIADTAYGVGHFEPLRHYAEVHLLLEAGEPNSGLIFDSRCSIDMLDTNWQRLILTHLQEREHLGVLTGAAITDMKITLLAGRAHNKHTEGGDFRQATYRAIRQGLKEAKSILLEPYYEFRLELPEPMIGRGIADVERMKGTFEGPFQESEMAVLIGKAPVAMMGEYQMEVAAYTKGHGRLFCMLKGYQPCLHADEIIEKSGYDAERDIANPTGSVFCSHGAGYPVPWNEVKEHMHIESQIKEKVESDAEIDRDNRGVREEERWIDVEEVDEIISRTFNANKKSDFIPHKGIKRGNRIKREVVTTTTRVYKKPAPKENYLLVDGYNIVYAWEELRELAGINIDSARDKLLDILCDYQGMKKCKLIVVFDAYRVKGHRSELMDYHNIHVVYTKEAETADRYIERFAHEHKKQYNITVATSDGMEQIIIRGQECRLLSARDLEIEVGEMKKQTKEACEQIAERGKSHLFDELSVEQVEGLAGLESNRQEQ